MRDGVRVAFLVLVLGLAGCAPSPGSPAVAFQLTQVNNVEDFAGFGTGTEDAPAELATATVLGGTVEVSGIIFVPDQCDRISAHLLQAPGVIALHVRAQLSSAHGECASGGRIMLMQYAARLSRLPRGSYRLRVVNEYRGLRPGDPAAARWKDRIAYDQPLVVP